jgi:hypothetical protein
MTRNLIIQFTCRAVLCVLLVIWVCVLLLSDFLLKAEPIEDRE